MKLTDKPFSCDGRSPYQHVRSRTSGVFPFSGKFLSSALAAFIFLVSLGLLSTGCNREDSPSAKVGKNGEITFTVTSANSSAATKSSADALSSGASLSLGTSVPTSAGGNSVDAERTYQIYYDFDKGENVENPQGSSYDADGNLMQSSDTKFSGEVFTVSSSTGLAERIDWLPGDKITVFECVNKEYATYTIEDVTPGSSGEERRNSTATLNSSSPLKWHDGSDHQFIAIYPSMEDIMEQPYVNYYSGAQVRFQERGDPLGTGIGSGAVIPEEQYCTLAGNRTYKREGKADMNETWYEPNMKYAYMGAFNEVSSSDVPMNNHTLTFYPLFNSVEVKLFKPKGVSGTVKLKSAKLEGGTGTGENFERGGELCLIFDDGLEFCINGHQEYHLGQPVSYFPNAGDLAVLGAWPGYDCREIYLKFLEADGITPAEPVLEEYGVAGSKPVCFTFLAMAQDNPLNIITQLELTLTLDIAGTEVTKTLQLKDGNGWIPLPSYKKLTITNMQTWDNAEYYLTQPGDITLGVLTNDGSEAEATIAFESYKTNSGSTTKIPVDVSVDFSLDGTTFYTADQISSATSGDASTLKAMLQSTPFSTTSSGINYTGKVYLSANTNTKPNITATLKGRAPGGGTITNPQDLSMYPVSAVAAPFSGSRRSGPVTANSYAVGRAGWYMFPCVYGNAIDSEKNTSSPYTNGQAYSPSVTSDYALTPFIGHTGAGISSPFIHQYTPISLATDDFINSYEAVIVWQDVPNGEQFLTLGGSSGLMSAALQGSGSVPYICFNIDQSKIQEGNVVIALRDKTNKTIVWSWHIWVTAGDLTPVQVNMYPQESNTEPNLLMSYPLGWCEDRYPERSFYVRLTQVVGGLNKIFKVKQRANILGNAPYYQWGRKDPLIGSDGTYPHTARVKSHYSPAGYQITTDEITINATIFDGKADQIAEKIREPYVQKHATSVFSLEKMRNLWHATNEVILEVGDWGTVPVKTIYDPCPPGFSVPRKSFATGFINLTPAESDIAVNQKREKFHLIEEKGDNGWEQGFWLKKTPQDEDGYYVPALGYRVYFNSSSYSIGQNVLTNVGGDKPNATGKYYSCSPSQVYCAYTFSVTCQDDYESVSPNGRFSRFSEAYNIIPAAN